MICNSDENSSPRGFSTSIPSTQQQQQHQQPSVLSCLSTLARAGLQYGENRCPSTQTPTLLRPHMMHPGQQFYRYCPPSRPGQYPAVPSSPIPCPSSVFPLQERTNLGAGPSQNFVFQTLLRDYQQVKAEFEQYKQETVLKFMDQEETIRGLKENVTMYQKKMLETKLQKEVHMAREKHAFQEINQVVDTLLQKLSHNDSDNEPHSSPLEVIPVSECGWDAGSDCGQACEDIIRKMRILDEKITNMEGRNEDTLSRCRVAEDNLKTHMEATNTKLDQIITCMSVSEGQSKQSGSKKEKDEDSQTVSTDEILYSDDSMAESRNSPTSTPTSLGRNEESSLIFEESSIVPARIILDRSRRIGMKKRKLFCPGKGLKKQLPRLRLAIRRRKTHQIADDDVKPPVLHLPCRIPLRRYSETMPVLYPEVTLTTGTDQKPEIRNVKPPKGRSGDALIGIKQENASNQVHGKDFSKPGFACLCGAKFTGAGGLYVHQVKAMEIEKFECRSCGKKFHYFSGLKAHRKSAHKQDLTQEVGCSRCGQVFKSKKERQGHLDIRGQTCWLSGSYQSKDWQAIRERRNLS